MKAFRGFHLVNGRWPKATETFDGLRIGAKLFVLRRALRDPRSKSKITQEQIADLNSISTDWNIVK